MNNNKKDILKAICLIIVYFIFMFCKLPDQFENLNIIIKHIIVYGTLIVMSICLFFNKYLEMLKKYFENFKSNLKFSLKKLITLYLIYLPISSLIVMIIGPSTNQTYINALPIWYTFIFSILYAPLVEEMVFRFSIRELFKNNIAFIFISGILFGLIHTIGQEPNLLNTILCSIPYIVMGIYIAYIYVKTDNIVYCQSLHFANNFIAILLLVLAK